MTSSAASVSSDTFSTLVNRPKPPLVTVVVVNYNFGRFLRDTIASVYAQSYPRVQCLVVDNASTDDSCAIVEELQRQHPTLELLRREANDGQTAATIDGVAAAKGAYVVLLDADDLLLPHCIETHIQVHLTSRFHVGFTCGDMLQMVGDQVVLSTGEAMAGFIRANTPPAADLLRSPHDIEQFFKSSGRDVSKQVYLVPKTQKDWVWSPTSGFCFRKDALDLFCDNPAAITLRSQTDLYLALGINAISGSILIDSPVFVYRLHGSNVFSNRAQMAGILSYDPARTQANATIARRLLIDQMVSKIGRFVQEPWQAMGLMVTLRRLDVRGGEDAGRWASHLARTVTRYESEIVKAVGKTGAMIFMLFAGVSWLKIWDLAWRKARPS